MKKSYNREKEENPIEEVEEIVEAVEPEIIEPEPKPEPVTVFGIVSDCERLNIRESPSIDSDSIGVIERDSEIMIDEANSTDEFYSVCTKAGIEGFCMKQFISIRQ